jgi:general secretion pathway protein D
MAAAGMPGMPGQPTTFSATGSGRRLTTSIEESVLLGRVLMNYDDRTNAIILITQEVNFAFFEKIIKALDVKTNQDFKTRVFFLNYADALEMADMLYSFVQGAAPASTGRAFRGTTGTTGTTRGTAVGGATTRRSSTSGRNASSRSSRATMVGESRSSVAGRSTFGTGARQRARTAGTTPAAPGMPGGPTSPGAAQAEQLIEIIPDQRNNAIVAFAPEADLEAIAELIKQLDVFPPQVHIDVVVAEINISGDTTFGIDLLQSVKQKGGFAGAGGSRTLAQGFSDPKTLTKAAAVAGAIPTGGLTYFMTFFGDDLGAIIQALAQDDKFKVLQTPHLYTSNNQRARVFVGESRPFVTGTYTTDTGTRSNYENVDIGVGLEVTPLINPDGVVTFDIYQTVDQVSGTTLIDSNAVPIISRREAEAVGVTLKDGQIIVLGGLTSNSRHQIVSKTPVLGDIPLLGNLFKTTTWNDRKTELVFFMRPKVIRTLEEAQRYTWSFVEKNKDLRTMPIRDVEGYSPLMDKRYSAKLKALDRLDKSDRYGPGP